MEGVCEGDIVWGNGIGIYVSNLFGGGIGGIIIGW